jgi:N-acyl-D-aspartate/D-glutamate deacylase
MIFSVLYRPITRHHKTDYLISEYSGTSDASIAMMKHVLTMDIVFGALGFFLDLLKDLLNYTLTYTTTQLTKMDKQSRATLKGLAKNGVDITQSHSYLVKMLRDLTQLLDSTSINV